MMCWHVTKEKQPSFHHILWNKGMMGMTQNLLWWIITGQCEMSRTCIESTTRHHVQWFNYIHPVKNFNKANLSDIHLYKSKANLAGCECFSNFLCRLEVTAGKWHHSSKFSDSATNTNTSQTRCTSPLNADISISMSELEVWLVLHMTHSSSWNLSYFVW